MQVLFCLFPPCFLFFKCISRTYFAFVGLKNLLLKVGSCPSSVTPMEGCRARAQPRWVEEAADDRGTPYSRMDRRTDTHTLASTCLNRVSPAASQGGSSESRAPCEGVLPFCLFPLWPPQLCSQAHGDSPCLHTSL